MPPCYHDAKLAPLGETLSDNLPDAYGIFVAPYVCERAAAVCKEAGIGYLDLGGTCRLFA